MGELHRIEAVYEIVILIVLTFLISPGTWAHVCEQIGNVAQHVV